MKILKLNSDFIKQAYDVDNNFLIKVRPCIVLTVYTTGKQYIVPITSSEHSSAFALRSNDSYYYIHFEKAFPLVQNCIIDGNYRLNQNNRWLFSTAKRNYNSIERAFNTYIINHPGLFTPNQEAISNLQDKYFKDRQKISK